MEDTYNYAAQSGSIKIEHITSDKRNQGILRRLKNNAPDFTKMLLCPRYYRDRNCDYVPTGDWDMGFLGYFIGSNTKLLHLDFYANNESPLVQDFNNSIGPFCSGLNHNKSIQKLEFSDMVLFGGEIFQRLSPFFKNNYNLTDFVISHCQFGAGCVHLLSLALGGCTTSLKIVDLCFYGGVFNGVDDEPVAEMFVALSVHPHLEELHLISIRVREGDCVALSTLLQWTTNQLHTLSLVGTGIGSEGVETLKHAISNLRLLRTLHLSGNEIDDKGLDHLLMALENTRNLQELDLSHNQSISVKGWKKLSKLLENSNLVELDLIGNGIDDEVAITFAIALANNCTLKTLNLLSNPAITNRGWYAFSSLVCDTTNINKTFLSNHTLQSVGLSNHTLQSVGLNQSLELNCIADKKRVPIEKILKHHGELNMQSFFEREFKVLPSAVNWFKRADDCTGASQADIRKRKLSAIYQFIRGMAPLYIESRLLQKLSEIRARKRKLQ